MKRTYTTFQVEDLRGMSYDHLTTRFNYRNHPTLEQDVVCLRNCYGDTFELRFDIDKVRIWTASGGVSLGEVDTSARDVGAILDDVEAKTRKWSEGYVPCAGCGKALRRFLRPHEASLLRVSGVDVEAVELAYHGGRYCRACAPTYAHLAAKEVD